jgi:hypothetical protein
MNVTKPKTNEAHDPLACSRLIEGNKYIYLVRR